MKAKTEKYEESCNNMMK